MGISNTTTRTDDGVFSGTIARAPSAQRSTRVCLFTVDREKAKQVQPAADDDAPARGLERLLAYLDANRETALLKPLDGASKEGSNRFENWQVPLADGTQARSMGGRYLLRVGSKADSLRLEEMLRRDPRVQNVDRPPAYRQTIADRERALSAVATIDAPAPRVTPCADDDAAIAAANATVQWGLEKCGFRHVWDALDVGHNPGPIGMIDNGGHHDHPEIKSRVHERQVLANASVSDHAGSVAAIMCALRGGGGGLGGEDMDGCCSAEISLYNVWTRHHGLDHAALYSALMDAVDRKLPVVNMSIWVDDDPQLRQHLDECEAASVVVVAAMGNSGDTQKFFPAAHPNVIAVAATNPCDRRHVHSSIGPHAFIGAPGENIFTVVGDSAYDRVSGTSYAAAFVTAAVWLAKRQRPELTNGQVRELLSRSVVPTGVGRTPELGYGRLDMKKLVKELPNV